MMFTLLFHLPGTSQLLTNDIMLTVGIIYLDVDGQEDQRLWAMEPVPTWKEDSCWGLEQRKRLWHQVVTV